MTEYRVWPATNGPDTSGSDGTPINVGLEFYVTSQAWCTHARVYRGTADVEPDNVRLYQVDTASTGTMLAEVASPALAGLGWVEIAFATPVELTPLQAYKVVSHNPDHYTATSGYFAPGGEGDGGITNGILVAPDTAQIAAQATFAYNALPVFPDGTFNGGNYWVDVVVTDVDPTASGAVDVDGSASSAASLTGAVTVARDFTGTAPEADSGGGEMGATRDVSGLASAASTLTGAAGVSRAFTGTLGAAASTTGALTVAGEGGGPESPADAYSFTAGRLTAPFVPRGVSTSFTAGRLSI